MRFVSIGLASAALIGCRPGVGIGESRTDFANGYAWIEHDLESQVIDGSGEILIDHVKEAYSEGPMVRGKLDNGSAFTIDTRNGALRKVGDRM